MRVKDFAKKMIPDKLYIKFLYKKYLGKELNLENPQTFNEKLQWLKLYNRKPEYSIMVDKYEVKKYVANIIGEEYIIPILGVWDKPEDINFDLLPNKFVLKCTHNSGGLVICEDKNSLDKNNAIKKLNKNLKINFYLAGREWPYKNVKPRIIAEKFMSDSVSKDLKDYKFFCFNGKAKFFKIDFDRFINHRANYYNTDGTPLEFCEAAHPSDFSRKISIPRNLKKMVELAEKLAKNIPFVRIDFYEVDDKVYFGEITFFSNAGFAKFQPEEYDKIIGDYLLLPNVKAGKDRNNKS